MPRVAIFAGIVKNVTMFIKKIKKLKELEIINQNASYFCIS